MFNPKEWLDDLWYSHLTNTKGDSSEQFLRNPTHLRNIILTTELYVDVILWKWEEREKETSFFVPLFPLRITVLEEGLMIRGNFYITMLNFLKAKNKIVRAAWH